MKARKNDEEGKKIGVANVKRKKGEVIEDVRLETDLARALAHRTGHQNVDETARSLELQRQEVTEKVESTMRGQKGVGGMIRRLETIERGGIAIVGISHPGRTGRDEQTGMKRKKATMVIKKAGQEEIIHQLRGMIMIDGDVNEAIREVGTGIRCYTTYQFRATHIQHIFQAYS